MAKRKRRAFTKEFKAQAVQIAVCTGAGIIAGPALKARGVRTSERRITGIRLAR